MINSMPIVCRRVAADILESDGLNDGEHLNTGWCGTFSQRVTMQVPGALDRAGPGHCWVEYNGMHYDAERPDGVPDPILLPCFQRQGYNHSNRPSALCQTQPTKED